MTITTILLAVFGALLVVAYALWDLGAERLVASFGRFVVRTMTFGRVRIAEDADECTVMAVFCRHGARAFGLCSHHCFTRALTWMANHLTDRSSQPLFGVARPCRS